MLSFRGTYWVHWFSDFYIDNRGRISHSKLTVHQYHQQRTRLYVDSNHWRTVMRRLDIMFYANRNCRSCYWTFCQLNRKTDLVVWIGGLAKPLLKIGHGWVITSHIQQWMWSHIHALFQLICVSEIGRKFPYPKYIHLISWSVEAAWLDIYIIAVKSRCIASTPRPTTF